MSECVNKLEAVQKIADLPKSDAELSKKDQNEHPEEDEGIELERVPDLLTMLQGQQKCLQEPVDKENKPGLHTNSHDAVHSYGSVSSEVYDPKATKTFQLVKTDLRSGRIHLKALLREFRWKRLYFMDSKVLLLYDDDGWSSHRYFITGNVYKMRQEPDEGFDISIGYSDAKIDEVEEHFNLSIGQG
eukprot:jgi/Hompol1/2674/HPOL_006110-RA